MDWETLRAMRRATTARSALDWIALICLIAGGFFWYTLFWAIIVPPNRPLQQSIIAVTMGTIYTLVLPLLWSMLVPTTPAGMLLQKTQHRTWGFAVIIGAALFLTWHSGMLLQSWWLAQPSVQQNGQDVYLTISCVIAFVLIPALCWTQVTPEQWIAQIMQAREVMRLKHALALDEAAMKAMHLRAISIMHGGLSNATLAERQELAGILGGFARTQREAMQSMAYTFRDVYGVEMRTSGNTDAELAQGYKEVALLLAESADEQHSVELTAREATPATAERPVAVRAATGPTVALNHNGSHQDAETIDRQPTGRSQQPTGTGPLRTATDRRSTGDRPPDDLGELYRFQGDGTWTRVQVENLFQLQKSAATARINGWLQAGWIRRLTEDTTKKDAFKYVISDAAIDAFEFADRGAA